MTTTHVEHALNHGRVHLTGDNTAVAVWIDNHTEPAPPPPDYDTHLAAAGTTSAPGRDARAGKPDERTNER